MLLRKYSVMIVYRSVWPEHSAVRFRFQDESASGGGVPPALHQRRSEHCSVVVFKAKCGQHWEVWEEASTTTVPLSLPMRGTAMTSGSMLAPPSFSPRWGTVEPLAMIPPLPLCRHCELIGLLLSRVCTLFIVTN